MTNYVVKHDAGDYRLHKSDGTETGDTWSWDSDPLESGWTDKMLSEVNQASDNHNYRDLTLDNETVPWEDE